MKKTTLLFCFLLSLMFIFVSCNSTNGTYKRMKSKKKGCDCPGWTFNNPDSFPSSKMTFNNFDC